MVEGVFERRDKSLNLEKEKTANWCPTIEFLSNHCVYKATHGSVEQEERNFVNSPKPVIL